MKKNLIVSIPTFSLLKLIVIVIVTVGSFASLTAQITGMNPDLEKAIQKYEYLDSFHKGFAKVGDILYKKYGVINHEGKEIVPVCYDNVSDVDTCGFIYVNRLDKFHKKGEPFRPMGGRKAQMFGCYDSTGREVVPCQYLAMNHFSEGLAAVAIGDPDTLVWGFVNTKGETVIKPQYSAIKPFSEGLAAVKINGDWGYIDRAGKVVIKPKYKEAGSFRDGIAVVRTGSTRNCHIIDRMGKTVFKENYAKIYNYSEGLAPVYSKIVIVMQPASRLASVKYDPPLHGYIDRNFKEVIPLLYKSYSPFNEGIASVSKMVDDVEKYGIIDKRGEVVIPFEYEETDLKFRENLLAVKKNGKWGYIDRQNQVVIPIKYDYAVRFGGGLAEVKIADKYGFINTKGEVVIPAIYDGVYSFENRDTICVNKNGKFGYINKKGSEVIPFKYDSASNFSEGLAVVKIDEGDRYHYAYIDTQGREYPAATVEKDRPIPRLVE